MDALEVYTKRNIRDYLARPEEKYDKEYSKERQEIRKYIRKDDLEAKKATQMVRLIGAIFYAWLIVFNFPKLVGFFSNPATVVFYIHL